MRVVVLYGLPGVGKLAVARGLARLLGYRVFHNHLVFDAVEALFPFGSPTFVELRDRLWLELLERAIREKGAFPPFSAPTGAVSIDTSGMTVEEAVIAADHEVNRASLAT